MNIFTLTIPAQSQPKNLNYNVKIKGYDGLWRNIFYGKVFVQSGQTIVDIELDDILWSYKFNGEGYFYPALNSTGDDYVMCSTTNNLTNYWHNDVQVNIPSMSATTTKTVEFFRNKVIGYRSDSVASNTVALWMDYQPIAHIPAVVPTGFEYRQLVWSGTFARGIDGTNTVTQRSKLGTLVFSGGEKEYSINQTPIAVIDECAKPFYLAWMTNTGAMQVQPFLKSSDFTLNYTNNKRIDLSDYEWNYNKSVGAKWKLKSTLLTDIDYKAFGELFNSPYLILIDTATNKMHFVNVKTTDYTMKKNGITSKKIYFDVEVESCEKMNL